MYKFLLLVGLWGWLPWTLAAQLPDTENLTITPWTAAGMTQDPVALAFDRAGKLYLVESARRTTVDLDIRAHRTWLLEDLANDDFQSMRTFFRRRMAPSLSEENKAWLTDHNQDGVHDFRDLTTISERIRLIEDTDGDGLADKSTVYAEGFQEEFTGVAAGVLPYEGDVLMTVYPDLWRLRDLDGDGKADGRVSMFRGFGVHAAFDGHDLHGLTVGPEGKIYFSCGDNGFSVITREGQRLHHPNTGGVLRMNPDGSDLEVYAIGLRNVQEFDFDRFGNMFAVDNDGDLEDERERAVYIAEGSDAGWRLNWQFRSAGWAAYNGGMTYNPWTAEGMWKPPHSEQPAYITPPMQNYSVGPGGFKFNPGTALNEEYRDFFFCVQFPVQKITAFRTRTQGAGFEMVDEHVLHAGLMVSSLNFGPDGGLYLADWVGKWEPNGEGVVYRIDDPRQRGSSQRQQVQRFLNDGVADQSSKSLTELLGHIDRRVRQLAQNELVRRRKGYRLFQVAVDANAAQLARIHALWGLIQLRDVKQLRWLGPRLPWTDADPQIRQQCARVAGDLRLPESPRLLVQLLRDEVPLVRSHAAIALGKLGSEQAVTPLWTLLKQNADLDPFIRHAAVMGLAGCADAVTLAAQSSHPSDAVRMGGVLALRRHRDAQIINYLQDRNVRVQREAVRAIHDDFSIPDAMPALAGLPDIAQLPADEPIWRRVLSANLRVGDQHCAERMADFIARPAQLGELTVPLQVEALQCLAVWHEFPLVDRVEGRIRQSRRADEQAGKKTLIRHLETFLALSVPEITAELTRIASDLDLPIQTDRLHDWVLSEDQPMPTRVAALQLLHRQQSDLGDLLEQLLETDWESATALQRAAFQILGERDPQRAFARIDLTAPLPARRFFIAQLPMLELPEADELLARQLRLQATRQADPAVALDVVAAARSHPADQFVQGLQAFAARNAEHPWGEYQFAVQPGDVRRGEAIYRGHVTAQCIRCHDAGGPGKQAGPVLQGIGGRVKRDYLVEALVAPNASIAKGFETTLLVLDDGRVVSGTVVEETGDRISLGTPQGKIEVVDKSAIEERLQQGQSAMPTMQPVLTPLEVRDLVEYLASLK